jgi:AcrR family transcriptional regulator
MPDARPQHRPRPRKAPKQARSQETVKVIVEAAARILERDGFEGFSTNAVAERAGVSIGSLYQYFPSKEALIGALIVRETSQLIDDAEAATTEPSGAAALSALVHACIAHQFRRPKLARLLDFEEARLPFDADTEQVSERFRAILSTVLLRPDFPRQSGDDAATRDVMAIIKGMVDAAGVYGETDQHELTIRVRRAVFGYLNASA